MVTKRTPFLMNAFCRSRSRSPPSPAYLPLRLGGRDHALDRGHDRGIAEGAGLAHLGEQIVAADMQHIDAVDRRDLIDVGEALDGLDHAHDQRASLSAGTLSASGTGRRSNIG